MPADIYYGLIHLRTSFIAIWMTLKMFNSAERDAHIVLWTMHWAQELSLMAQRPRDVEHDILYHHTIALHKHFQRAHLRALTYLTPNLPPSDPEDEP